MFLEEVVFLIQFFAGCFLINLSSQTSTSKLLNYQTSYLSFFLSSQFYNIQSNLLLPTLTIFLSSLTSHSILILQNHFSFNFPKTNNFVFKISHSFVLNDFTIFYTYIYIYLPYLCVFLKIKSPF